jgi:hypothetical protein
MYRFASFVSGCVPGGAALATPPPVDDVAKARAAEQSARMKVMTPGPVCLPAPSEHPGPRQLEEALRR